MGNIRPTDGTSHQIVPNTPIDTLLYALPPYINQFLLSKLIKMIKVGIWEDGEDVNKGNHLLMECIMALLNPVTGIDRIYRLLDTTFYGTEYNAATDGDTGITTVTPAIPEAPSPNIFPIVPVLERMKTLQNVLVTGSVGDTVLSDTDSAIYLLQQILAKITADEADLTSIVGDLEQVLILLA